MKTLTKIIITINTIWTFSLIDRSDAGLPRPLKDNEIKTLEDNIKKNPDNIVSRKFLASHFFSKNQWKEVIRVLLPAKDYLPNQDLNHLTESILKIEDERAARQLVNIILSKKKLTSENALLLVRIYNLQIEKTTEDIIKKKQLTASINLLKAVQKSDPENRKIYTLWLKTLEKFVPHYQYDALVVIEKMKKADVKFTTKHYSLVCKLNFLANYSKQTLETCKEATQIDKENPINWIYLGKTHLTQGQKEKGNRMLSSVGEKYSHSEEALWATANMYQENRDFVSAYDFYKKATHHKNAKPRSFLGLAISSFELKKYDEALKAFRKHCQSTKTLHHEFRRASGLLKIQMNWQKKYRSAMHGCQK